MNHQTRYELRDDAELASVLTYTAAPDGPAVWQILLTGPGGTEDLYGTHQTPAPDAIACTPPRPAMLFMMPLRLELKTGQVDARGAGPELTAPSECWLGRTGSAPPA